MSDSDDDWFEKDLDDFVVKSAASGVEKISLKPESGADAETKVAANPLNYFDDDYGGNYNKSTGDNEAKKNATSNRSSGTNSVHVQPISFKKLTFMLEQTPLNVFLDIIQCDSGFCESLHRTTITSEMIILTINVILKIIDLPFSEHLKLLTGQVIGAKSYWKQIENALQETVKGPAGAAATTSKPNKKAKSKVKVVVPKNDLELWQCVSQLCASLHKRDLPLSEEFVKKVLTFIDSNKNTELNVLTFREGFERMQESESIQTVRDHRDIYPTMDELKAPQEDYVKVNIVKGRYSSVSHYLDVHLSLLREDFVSPLRDGICQLISDVENGGDLKSNHNIRVYSNVRIIVKQKEVNAKNGFKADCLMVDLEPKCRTEDGRIDIAKSEWYKKQSKKLMYGSLLCLTKTSDFDDLIVAVVSNRDAELLAQGYIQIEIIKTHNITALFDQDFIMCESDVYFESYRHVYAVLKHFSEETFPLRNYIIDVDTTSTLPGYIPEAGNVIFTYKKSVLDIKNTAKWPTAEELQLNESQLGAMKRALTQKFSVIQGPPGCGKTFIGLEIVSTLLLNTDAQILIICYTNHALDQFLAGILNYTEEIVRIGNQSKNELLDRFNVKQLSDNIITDKRLKNCLYKAKCDYAELLQRFQQIQLKMKETSSDEGLLNEFVEIQQNMQSVNRLQEELKQVAEYNLIKSKRVVGMTSTGAARCNSLVQLLQTPIVIIEEAAEILEAHIVAALTQSVQHLILIGDHQQLRPTTSVYKLAQHYQMDISLFERMINNNINCATLTTQYRMRQEIANLIRPSIYNELHDSDSVKRYGPVVGCEKDLFFLDHRHLESADSDETTKKNVHESQLVCALCNYLILQGYQPTDITILTTYNGQIYQIAQDRKKYQNLRKVRVTAVDNFQGEDNRIIILSLVRSNTSNSIGYLGFKNRICVALSRAKEGFFVVGNMSLLAGNSKLWLEIRRELVRQSAITDELTLQCQTHGHITKIQQASDIDVLKYGGCLYSCDKVLACGHLCSHICHSAMFEHYSDCACNKYRNN